MIRTKDRLGLNNKRTIKKRIDFTGEIGVSRESPADILSAPLATFTTTPHAVTTMPSKCIATTTSMPLATPTEPLTSPSTSPPTATTPFVSPIPCSPSPSHGDGQPELWSASIGESFEEIGDAPPPPDVAVPPGDDVGSDPGATPAVEENSAEIADEDSGDPEVTEVAKERDGDLTCFDDTTALQRMRASTADVHGSRPARRLRSAEEAPRPRELERPREPERLRGRCRSQPGYDETRRTGGDSDGDSDVVLADNGLVDDLNIDGVVGESRSINTSVITSRDQTIDLLQCNSEVDSSLIETKDSPLLQTEVSSFPQTEDSPLSQMEDSPLPQTEDSPLPQTEDASILRLDDTDSVSQLPRDLPTAVTQSESSSTLVDDSASNCSGVNNLLEEAMVESIKSSQGSRSRRNHVNNIAISRRE